MEETSFRNNEIRNFRSKKSFFQWLGKWEVNTWCFGMAATVLFLLWYSREGNPVEYNGWFWGGLLLFYGAGTFITAWCATLCFPCREEETRWTRHGNRLIILWLLLVFLGMAMGMRGISLTSVVTYGLGVLGLGVAIFFSLPIREVSETTWEEEEEEEATSAMPEGVTQQWIRERSPTGEERISGQVVATLAPWQKKSVLYLAFCPPFAHCPEVECYSLVENGEVERGMEIFPHGVKIPVRRMRVSGLEESLTFHFCAWEKGEKNT